MKPKIVVASKGSRGVSSVSRLCKPQRKRSRDTIQNALRPMLSSEFKRPWRDHRYRCTMGLTLVTENIPVHSTMPMKLR